MTTLSIEELEVQYQLRDKTIRAVDKVSLFLKNNESLGIVGESACGKSTLGLAIIRSVPGGKIVNGDITLDGKSTLKMTEAEFAKTVRWKKISMVFQGAMNSLDPVFSIRQQFEEILQAHDYRGDRQKTINDIIDSVGLPPTVLDKFPHELSGGMKQRVVIAMALVLRPSLVIADEPTTALDVLVQAQILSLLKKLKKEGMSLILISHDLGIISEIADNVGIMYAGKIVEFGTLQEVYSNPKHPYTQALFKSMPKIKGEPELISLKGTPPNLANMQTGCRFYDRCTHAMEKCRKEPPKIKTESGHVLCWLYE
ncbi:Dipeptide transport ATP-binding protein DppD [Candidatus Nitrosotalea sp. TS]|uniref:ABC transporter ATP-binding protein n=1 Tax=Candidatus Nitrosotalea sp. TS TaxID=2341020 RepID=UPI00140C68AE|nr:ABC transporter ATP-binding protein [Candidatus Nitrosotalea sp. TS]NHI02939.1 Dipeptide transport ATP-binding protein DppD [Candidatus Nitrosotalea sp. TS]